MELRTNFDLAAPPVVENPPPLSVKPARRASPFCIRLTVAERERLLKEAGGVRLGTYVKAKVLGEPLRARRASVQVEDREDLARILALLGRSHLANNLNQLAKAVNTGSLPLTPETETELLEAIRDVRALRVLLMQALGLRPERLA